MLRKLSIVGLAVPLLAFIGALVYLFYFGESEPSFEDATRQLASDHTVYALDLQGRGAALVAPFEADPESPLPLVVALHDDGSHVWAFAQDFGLIDQVNARRILLLMPNAPRDASGERRWNQSGECCGDEAYVEALIEEASRYVSIESEYVVGHGSGGLIADRLACMSSSGAAGVVTVTEPDAADDQDEGIQYRRGCARESMFERVRLTLDGASSGLDANALGERIVDWIFEQRTSQ